MKGVEAAIVLPLRSHYATVLEIISPIYLRDKLHLKDDDEVDIVVSLSK